MPDQKPALPEAAEMTLWVKPACPQCVGAKLGLQGQGVTPTFKELLAAESADALAAFKANGFSSAPILQFPEVRDGDYVLFEARTVAGNQVGVIEEYGRALKALARQSELVAA